MLRVLLLSLVVALPVTVRGETAAAPVLPKAAWGDGRTSGPDRKLTAKCYEQAESLRRKLDGTFSIRVVAPFVIAGDIPVEQMDRHIADDLVRPAQAMWNCYFDRKPNEVITVLLFGSQKSYHHWAMKLFRDDDLPYFGYYKPDERTLVMNISTGSGVLVHELTHALIVYDFPNVPLWFNETLASLHENCAVGSGQLLGKVNWRLATLRSAMQDKRLRPLRDMVAKRDFYDGNRSDNYAQARYFGMYMQKQGVLAKFYRHFRDNSRGSNADVKAVEAVFGKSIDRVEAEYLRWASTLRQE